MTVIAQDDHLTAAAWAACDRMSETEPKNDFVYKTGPKCPSVGPFTPKTKQNLNFPYHLNTLLHRDVMGKIN